MSHGRSDHCMWTALHADCTACGLHCTRTALHADCTARGLHCTRTALHADCTARGLHCMWTAMHADCTACGLHSCRGCIIQGCTALQVHKHMSSGGNTLLLHPCCRLLLFPLFFFLFCFVTQGPICFMGKGAKITAGFSRIRKKLFPFALLEKCAAEKPIFTMSKR